MKPLRLAAAETDRPVPVLHSDDRQPEVREPLRSARGV
jgi:hypothetical protein